MYFTRFGYFLLAMGPSGEPVLYLRNSVEIFCNKKCGWKRFQSHLPICSLISVNLTNMKMTSFYSWSVVYNVSRRMVDSIPAVKLLSYSNPADNFGEILNGVHAKPFPVRDFFQWFFFARFDSWLDRQTDALVWPHVLYLRPAFVVLSFTAAEPKSALSVSDCLLSPWFCCDGFVIISRTDQILFYHLFDQISCLTSPSGTRACGPATDTKRLARRHVVNAMQLSVHVWFWITLNVRKMVASCFLVFLWFATAYSVLLRDVEKIACDDYDLFDPPTHILRESDGSYASAEENHEELSHQLVHKLNLRTNSLFKSVLVQQTSSRAAGSGAHIITFYHVETRCRNNGKVTKSLIECPYREKGKVRNIV